MSSAAPEGSRRDDSATGRPVPEDRLIDRDDRSATHADPDNGSHTPDAALPRDRHSVVNREKEEYGGIKAGSAFFGWLTATGTAVLLTALLTAAGAVVGVATGTSTADATDQADANAETIGIAGGILVLVVLFIAYYCGGYVAGRMARFNGLKQGLAVWLWAVVIAVVVAIVVAIAGNEYNVLGRLNSFPRIPVSEGSLTTGGIVALLLAAAASLVGALVGGLAGMRFHRKVDKAGLGR
ncbi:hypothetical protein Kfla_1113 [Kribbella flavida DSM 17836]|uniref:Uncharacterized protein n=1 Tax=Kribbella flavida (strain DSM 17836 / JCM 10339 / NBRC 14399) TaxID=479435 RepID=D2Q2N6_KRIFD|nr:hypothetical protein [Kribbella flavida]ADB30217.1 hypothetical protein Kfla_1113 [Kribbella flavida DSM 17836]